MTEDKFKEECGIFGIFNHPDAATLTALGLHALQHRGQEAAGIVSYEKSQFHAEHHYGLIGDTFTKPEIMQRLPGNKAIGHNRYATTGEDSRQNIQPFFADFAQGGFAIAHNGNLTNAEVLRRQLQKQGTIFHTTSDTEVILHLAAISKKTLLAEKFVDALKQIEGAFSLVALSGKKLIGCRDPLGMRPLMLGKLEDTWVLASETCAFDIIGAKYQRDISAGEMIVITKDKIESTFPFAKKLPRFCIFEHVYFSRPDSFIEGESVYNVRKQIGKQLAQEAPITADLIVPVPDSGTPAALGYSQQAEIPFELGIIRNHYVGRTFIAPSDAIRHMGVKLKHNANGKMLKGKKIVLVDDSIVRGTTSKKIVAMVKDAGASEVHMRIASPPTISGCYYGVDTPKRENLIASRMSVEEMAKFIGADSLEFVSLDGLYKAVGQTGRDSKQPQFCDACFTADYPTQLLDKQSKENNNNVYPISFLANSKK